jgi:hypothetical protein
MIEAQASDPAATAPQAEERGQAKVSRGPSTAQIAIVVAILGGGILLTALTSNVTQVAEPGIRLVDGKPFLVEKTGDWEGGPLEGLTEAERNVLPQDTEGARRIYTNSVGQQIYCSIVLEGKDVTSIHRPELCLTGQGWTLGKLQPERIATPAAKDGVLTVSRIDATRPVQLRDGRTGVTRSIFLYWFVGKDRVTASHPQRILLTTMDRVFRNRNARWAYILILAPVEGDAGTAVSGSEKNEKETMQSVAKFVQDIYPTLTLSQ